MVNWKNAESVIQLRFHGCHHCWIVWSLIWDWGCLLNCTQKHTCFMQTMQSQLMPALSATRLYSSSPAVAWPSGLGKLNLLENHAWKFEILVQQVLRHTNTKLIGTHDQKLFNFCRDFGIKSKVWGCHLEWLLVAAMQNEAVVCSPDLSQPFIKSSPLLSCTGSVKIFLGS